MPENTTCRMIRTQRSIGITSGLMSAEFDNKTGALTSLRNHACDDEYLKTSQGEGNPFRVYVDTTQLPPSVLNPNGWSESVPGALGGAVVESKDCRLVSSSFGRLRNSGTLELVIDHPARTLQFRLTIKMADGANSADCALTVRNTADRTHTIMTAFPHLTGLQLGPRSDTNMGLMLASFGSPGQPAWTESGGVYGREVDMQWQAVYEPSKDEALGIVVMDRDLLPKMIRRFPPSGLSVLYFNPVELRPGEEHRYPVTRIMANKGSWREVAADYGRWFSKTFKLRRTPEWYKQVDLQIGPWIPSAAEVAKAKSKRDPGAFTSYIDLPKLYLGDQYDTKEWAQYNEGVVTHPESYGPYMADGTYHLREDLGGAAALREGIARVHKIGRRVIFYVAGNSLLKYSDVLAGSNINDWLLLDSTGKMYDIGYPDGVSVCPGYEPWQNHLAKVCKRLLAETGADGIRLDELGCVVACFNPAHRHKSPFDYSKWLQQLLRKVRAAMDEVNPNAILLTEGPIDYFHQYTNGALQMFQTGRDIDAMRVAIPSYKIVAYHPGAVESGLNGMIGGKVTARRVEWPWSHRGVPQKPAYYQDGPGPELRWHELRATFRDAFEGMPNLQDPVASEDRLWVGRLWKASHYWLIIGGHEDATDLRGPTRVRLPELPDDTKSAYEIDAATLTVRDAHLERTKDGVYVTVTSPFGAVLLPKQGCPPMLSIDETAQLIKHGGETVISIRLFSPWTTGVTEAKVTVSAPGLEGNAGQIAVPGAVHLKAPADALPGYYPLTISGHCLPVKRWIKVN